MMQVMMSVKNLEQFDMYKDVLYIGDAIVETMATWMMKVQCKKR